MTIEHRVSRRAVLAAALTGAVAARVSGTRSTRAQLETAFSYPLGIPGRPLGDGFYLRHAFTVENTWYLPDHWHTGEDWYRIEGDTAGAGVFAIGDGQVVYTGGNYPGLVVIVGHADGLYSMYGHLDFAATAAVGDVVSRGDQIGTVLRRGDDIPNHLHFEVRSFLQTDAVNGDAPLYGFGCGPDCPPGPGYWPIGAAELPAEIGWRNPTHVIARRGLAGIDDGNAAVVVPSQPAARETGIWSAPADRDGAERIGDISLESGTKFGVLSLETGSDAPNGTSAEAYRVWYEVVVPGGESGWIQGVVPDTFETGGDGRPSTVRFNLIPDVETSAQ